MATYKELNDLQYSDDLQDKVEVACWVAANTIRTENVNTANHANRVIWAKKVFDNSRAEALRMLPMLLAQNTGSTVAQINNVTDAAIQNAVNAVVDLFATG